MATATRPRRRGQGTDRDYVVVNASRLDYYHPECHQASSSPDGQVKSLVDDYLGIQGHENCSWCEEKLRAVPGAIPLALWP